MRSGDNTHNRRELAMREDCGVIEGHAITHQ